MTITGVIYPLTASATGNLVVASDADLYQTHILSVLETEPGENPLRPLYGVPGALFDATQNLQVYAADVLRRLRREVPDCEFAGVGIIGDGGEALLEVVWSLQGVAQDSIQARLV